MRAFGANAAIGVNFWVSVEPGISVKKLLLIHGSVSDASYHREGDLQWVQQVPGIWRCFYAGEHGSPFLPLLFHCRCSVFHLVFRSFDYCSDGNQQQNVCTVVLEGKAVLSPYMMQISWPCSFSHTNTQETRSSALSLFEMNQFSASGLKITMNTNVKCWIWSIVILSWETRSEFLSTTM